MLRFLALRNFVRDSSGREHFLPWRSFGSTFLVPDEKFRASTESLAGLANLLVWVSLFGSMIAGGTLAGVVGLGVGLLAYGVLVKAASRGLSKDDENTSVALFEAYAMAELPRSKILISMVLFVSLLGYGVFMLASGKDQTRGGILTAIGVIFTLMSLRLLWRSSRPEK